MKNNLTKVLAIFSVLFLIICLVLLIVDYVNIYPFGSAPFYVYVLTRGIEFIVPSIVCFVLSKVLKR